MVAAFVFIQIAGLSSLAEMSALHGAMHAVPGVKTVHFVMGPTDVVAFVEAADQKALIAAVAGIRALNGVGTTDTRMVLPI